MPDIAPPSQASAPRPRAVLLEPTFLGALRGIWLFTWKTRLALARLPRLLLGLMILPSLVYLTLAFQDTSGQGAAMRDFNEFVVLLINRGRPPLKSEQYRTMQQIFLEEYQRIVQESPANPRRDSQFPTGGSTENYALDAGFRRLQERGRAVLNEQQVGVFNEFTRNKLDEKRGAPLTWTRNIAFYHWLLDFYFFVILPLSCVGSCGALIREELQADTLRFLTTRPQTRARLVLAKYLSQTAWLQIALLIQTLLLFAAAYLRQIPSLGNLLPLVLGTQFLAVLAWSALGTLMGLATRRYLPLALVYGLIVELGIGRIPTNINNLSLMRHLKTLLGHNSALQTVYEWPTQGTILSIGALLFAAGILVALAALLFTFREYHHTTEMQK